MADGTTSTMNIGAYGGGLEELYQRTGCGTGAGWSNEFETIRLGLAAYLNNGSGLDLTDIVAVRFEFGPVPWRCRGADLPGRDPVHHRLSEDRMTGFELPFEYTRLGLDQKRI